MTRLIIRIKIGDCKRGVSRVLQSAIYRLKYKENEKMINEKVLATVQGNPVTQSEVDEMVAMLTRQRGQNFDTPQGREMVLNQLINKKLLLLDAAKNLYEHNAEFKAELKKVKDDMLANYAVEKALEKVRVTDEEAKSFFEEHKDTFVEGEKVNASHILVDSEEKANELLSKINNKEISFEDAAKENSSCPSSQKGGNLGEFTRGQMVPEFDEACFTMEVGEIRGPIQTQFGYHIIMLNDKKAAQPMEYDAVKDEIKQRLLSEKQHQAYESKINQLKILYQVVK